MAKGRNKAKAKAANEGDPTTVSPSVVSDGSAPTAGPFDGEGAVDGEELDLDDEDDEEDELEEEETDLTKEDEDLDGPSAPFVAATDQGLAAAVLGNMTAPTKETPPMSNSTPEKPTTATAAASAPAPATQPELKRCKLVRGTIHDHAGKLINKGETFLAPAKDVGWMVDTGNVRLLER